MSQDNEEIIFDKFILEKKLDKEKQNIYKFNDNLTFSLVQGKTKQEYKNNEKYFVNIKKKNKNEHYIGVLTSNFKKELFGYILFYQGDEYLGQLLNEEKSGFGIYKFNKKDNNGKDIYIGYFSKNTINGEGIYINILKKDDYTCNIGKFDNGQFIKGKIYKVNNNFEKLEFKDEEKDNDDKNEKEVIYFEKKNDINLYSKGIMKDKRLEKGMAININDNGEVRNKFLFTLKNDLQYDFEYLNDEEKEKMLTDEFNKSNFVKYRETVEGIFSQIEKMIDEMKKNFDYAKGLNMGDDFKDYFSDKLNILMN